MKKDYMTRLEGWARWMLPRQEAEDVIADYRDIVSDPELLRDLGKPHSVVKPLAQSRQYRAWLVVFAVMAVCILAPGISPTVIGAPLWIYLFDGWVNHPYGAYLAVSGIVLTLVWFHWQGHKAKRLPKAIPILLAVFLVCIGAVLLFCWVCAQDFDAFTKMWGTMKTWIGPYRDVEVSSSFYLLQIAMCYGSFILALLGTYGLVKARMEDRRWAAVYVLAATAMLTALLVVDWTGRMDVSTFTTPEEAFRQMLLQCSGIAAVGLVGTGVALC